jgi:hypothetical protein
MHTLFETTERICMRFYLINRVILEEGLYLYNMHIMVVKYFTNNYIFANIFFMITNRFDMKLYLMKH